MFVDIEEVVISVEDLWIWGLRRALNFLLLKMEVSDRTEVIIHHTKSK